MLRCHRAKRPHILLSIAKLQRALDRDQIDSIWQVHVRAISPALEAVGKSTPPGPTMPPDPKPRDTPERRAWLVKAGERTRSLLSQFSDIMKETLDPGLPPRQAVEREIKIVPGSEPPCRAPY